MEVVEAFVVRSMHVLVGVSFGPGTNLKCLFWLATQTNMLHTANVVVVVPCQDLCRDGCGPPCLTRYQVRGRERVGGGMGAGTRGGIGRRWISPSLENDVATTCIILQMSMPICYHTYPSRCPCIHVWRSNQKKAPVQSRL